MSLRSVFKAGVSAVIYTNNKRLIKGNTVRDKFLVMADDVVFIDQANVGGGFLGIHATDLNVDVSFIKANPPAGNFLRDDGTWAAVDAIPSQMGHSNEFLFTSGSVLSWVGLTSNPVNGTFLFYSNYGIDSRPTAGSDILNIGATNANVINYGNSTTVHNFLGTAIYELQVNSYVQDKVITLNYGGGASTGIGVGFEVQESETITGYFKTNAARNGFSLKSPSIPYIADLNTNLLTASRAFSFPNAAGTFLVGSVGDAQIPYGSGSAVTSGSNFTWSGSQFKVGGSSFFGGSTAPTALVHVGATSGSLVPIRLTSAALITASSGALEFLTDRLYFTDTSNNRKTIAYTGDISAPGGSDGSIQYKSGSAMAGSPEFTFASGNLKQKGMAMFGVSVGEAVGAFVDIGQVTGANASLRIRPGGATPSTLNDGDIWYNGSFLYMRMGGTTKKFTLTV